MKALGTGRPSLSLTVITMVPKLESDATAFPPKDVRSKVTVISAATTDLMKVPSRTPIRASRPTRDGK